MSQQQGFRPLPDNYSAGGINYSFYKRGEKGAIYISDEGTSAEVFQIRVAEATETKIKGRKVSVPKRERTPSNESFGQWAWCVGGGNEEECLKRAENFLQLIDEGRLPGEGPNTLKNSTFGAYSDKPQKGWETRRIK